MSGFGIFNWHDGRKFVGYYEEDKKVGYGMFCWTDGRTINGFWLDGR